jgi:uncharacterized protein
VSADFLPPVIGPGAVYLPACRRLFESFPDLIKVAEIEPQPLWVKPALGPPHGSALHLAGLRQLPQSFLMHGVGAPFAGLHGAEDEQTPEFKRWAEWLNVGWTSEHMSLLRPMGNNGAVNCGFLMPPLQGEATIERAAKNIRARRFALDRPVAFETGVNYFAMREGEMPDGLFWDACASSADCGILLDISNIWVNARNGRTSVEDVLKQLPLERVWEVHLAGAQMIDGYWLDAHCGAINPDILAIAKEIIPSLPNLAAIIFEVAPDYVAALGETGFMNQMESVNRLWSLRSSGNDDEKSVPIAESAQPSGAHQDASLPTPVQWEAAVSQHLVTPRSEMSLDWLRPSDKRAFALYANLVRSARRGTISELLEYSVRLLLLALGEDRATRYIDAYCDSEPAHFFASEEARHFAAYALANDPDVVGFADLIRFEVGIVEAVADQQPVVIDLQREIETLIAAVDARLLPSESDGNAPIRIMIETSPEPRISRLVSS